MEQTQSGADLEERQLTFQLRRAHSADAPHDGREFVEGNRLLIDLDAFLDRDQMRRREQADAIALLLQDRRQHGRRRAFPLAAGDVDDAQPALRIAEQRQQMAHAVELEVAALRRFLLIIDAAKPEWNGLFVGHPMFLSG